MTESYRNFTLAECDRTLAKRIDEIRDGRLTFYQKFSCGRCHERITMNEPNKLFMFGHCEHCGHVTDLKRDGCNYMLHYAVK